MTDFKVKIQIIKFPFCFIFNKYFYFYPSIYENLFAYFKVGLFDKVLEKY